MAEEREDYVQMILSARNPRAGKPQARPPGETLAQLSTPQREAESGQRGAPADSGLQGSARGSQEGRFADEDLSETLGQLARHKKLYMLDDRGILYIVTARVVDRNVLHLRKSTAIEKDVKVRRVKEYRNDVSFEIDYWILELDFVFSKAANTEYIIIPTDKSQRLSPETARSLVKENLFEIENSKDPVGHHACKYISLREVGVGLEKPDTDSRLVVHIVDEQQPSDPQLIDPRLLEDSEEANPRGALDFKVQPVAPNKQQVPPSHPQSSRASRAKQASDNPDPAPPTIFTGYALRERAAGSKPSLSRQLLSIETQAAVTLQRYFRYKRSAIGQATLRSLQSVKQFLGSKSRFGKFLLFYSLLPSRVAVDQAIDLFTQK